MQSIKGLDFLKRSEIYHLAEKICKDKMNVSSERFLEAFGLEKKGN